MFKPIPDKVIAEIEAENRVRQQRLANALGSITSLVEYNNHADYHKRIKRRRQEVWLSVFGVTLSPKLAAAKAGVSRRTHRRWLRSDPTFCRNWNSTLERALDELAGIAMGKAMGYRTGDLDADGKPIRTEGSDTLIERFLDLDAPSDCDRVVSVDFSARKRRSVVVVGTTDGTSGGPPGPEAAS